MFELTMATEYGSFSIRINSSDISASEKKELHDLGTKWTSKDRKGSSVNLTEAIKKSIVSSSSSDPNVSGNVPKGERKLGSEPVASIAMGAYVEPMDGIFIQMLDYPKASLIPVLKELVLVAPLPMVSWDKILRGNYTEIKFSEETATKVLAVLKSHEIYATIIREGEFSMVGAG